MQAVEANISNNIPANAVISAVSDGKGMDAPAKSDNRILSSRLAGTYSPIIDHSKDSKHSSWKPSFGIDSVYTYYPLMRFGGYVFDQIYKDGSNNATKSMFRSAGESRNFLEKMIHNKWGDGGLNKFKNTIKAIKSKENMRYTETAYFAGLAAAFAVPEFKKIKEDTKLAVGAEQGIDEDKVTFSQMGKSNNPIVKSATDRFKWQQAFRMGAGVSFFPSVKLGIFSIAALITAERTIFYRPIAFDILKKAVNDVQINNLGEESKPELVENLVRVMQATRLDHKRETIPKEQIDGLRPVLNEIAQGIIDKQFGFTGALYIMGGGVLVPESPELSERNYQHVHDVGVTGVMHEAEWIRTKSGVAPSKTWESELRATREKGYLAESATDEALRDYRSQLIQKGPATSGSRENGRRGGSSRPDTGMVM